MEHHDILRTLAEVATAFAGFTGIVVVIGGRARGNLIALLIILASSLGVVFFGFVPDLVRAAHLEPSEAWRISTFLFATYHLVVILGSLRARKRARARGEPNFGPRHIVLLIPVGLSIVISQLLTAAGLASSWLFFFYLLGLLWLLAIATLMFAVLLLDTLSSRPSV